MPQPWFPTDVPTPRATPYSTIYRKRKSFGPDGNRVTFRYKPFLAVEFDNADFLTSYQHHYSWYIEQNQIVQDDDVIFFFTFLAIINSDVFGNENDSLSPLKEACSALWHHIRRRHMDRLSSLSLQKDFRETQITKLVAENYIDLAVIFSEIEICSCNDPFNTNGSLKKLEGSYIIPSENGWTIDLRAVLKQPQALAFVTYKEVRDGKLESLGIKPRQQH